MIKGEPIWKNKHKTIVVYIYFSIISPELTSQCVQHLHKMGELEKNHSTYFSGFGHISK